MAGNLMELSAHRFECAKEELQTAELLFQNAGFRSSINAHIMQSFMRFALSMHWTVLTVASTAA